MAPWYLFDFTTREVGSTNIALEHLPLTIKRLGEKEVLFDCFDKA